MSRTRSLLRALFTRPMAGRPRPARTLRVEPLEDRSTPALSVGGGYLGSGLVGEYFNSTALTGSPTFTRTDVRVNQDWGARGPGDSPSNGYSDVGANNFSVRWTGQLTPKFSEPYRFFSTANGAAKPELKAAGATAYTTLFDRTTDTGADVEVSNASGKQLTANTVYDVRLTFKDTTGDAKVSLSWASPSTPLEVIEVASPVGLGLGTVQDWEADDIFADRVKQSRLWTGPTDTDGNPNGDGSSIIFSGKAVNRHGTYRFSFTGKGTFDSNQLLGITQGYNAGTNTTSGSFRIDNTGKLGLVSFSLANTDRDGDFGADGVADKDGVRNLQIMMPVAPGSTSTYAQGVTFTNAAKNLLENFTLIRAMHATATLEHYSNGVCAERRLPSQLSQGSTLDDRFYGGDGNARGMAWEYLIQLANETGKDVYLNIPYRADANYVTQLARLVRYGSNADGVPYTAEVANPVHPPLSKNLKVYLEYANEVWNRSFPYSGLVNDGVAVADANAGSPIGYDGTTNGQVLGYRRTAEKSRWVSDIFRDVFGDAAMPGTSNDPRVRPVLMFQFGNLNGTAKQGLEFLDNYYNRKDAASPFTGPARAPDYYLYGAGGAWYNGVTNAGGSTKLAVNSGFEDGGTGWTFGPAGFAGVVASGDALLNGAVPEAKFGATKVAYVRSNGGTDGSFTQSVTTPPTQSASNKYMVSVLGLQQPGGDKQVVEVLVNGVVRGTFTPTGTWDTYFTEAFTLPAGQKATITVRGAAAAGDHYAFIDGVNLRSLDAMFDGASQTTAAGGDMPSLAGTEAFWADRYNLKTIGYEGGFSNGGDDSNPFADMSLMDPRVRDWMGKALRDYYAAGGDLPIGFVATSSSYGFTEPGNIHNINTPKINAVRDVTGAPPVRESLFRDATVTPTAGSAGDGRAVVFIGGSYQGSYTILNSDAVGDFVTYALNIPQAGSYNVKVRGWTGTDGGRFQAATAASLTGTYTNLGGVQDQYATAGAGEVYDFGTRTFTAGTHYVRFQVTGAGAGGGTKLRFDYIQYTPQFLVSLKTDTTAAVAGSSGKAATNVANVNATGGSYMRYSATANGDFVVFAVNVAAPGTYKLNVAGYAAPDGGIYQAAVSDAVNGTYTNVGGTQDLYPASGIRRMDGLGQYTFAAAGTYYVKFTVVGKNAASTNRTLGFDFLDLTPDFG